METIGIRKENIAPGTSDTRHNHDLMVWDFQLLDSIVDALVDTEVTAAGTPRGEILRPNVESTGLLNRRNLLSELTSRCPHHAMSFKRDSTASVMTVADIGLPVTRFSLITSLPCRWPMRFASWPSKFSSGIRISLHRDMKSLITSAWYGKIDEIFKAPTLLPLFCAWLTASSAVPNVEPAAACRLELRISCDAVWRSSRHDSLTYSPDFPFRSVQDRCY